MKEKIQKVKSFMQGKMVICGWCREKFEARVTKHKDYGYDLLKCSHCARLVNSSIKESTDNVGRKHIHRDLKDGDIV